MWWLLFFFYFFGLKFKCLILLLIQQEGRYEYKYIIDGEWTCNSSELVTSPNKDGHVNNYVEVSLKKSSLVRGEFTLGYIASFGIDLYD